MDRLVLPASTRLYNAQQVPQYAHFLTGGIASTVTFMLDGSSVDVAMVGSEGLVESAHLLGDGPIPTTGFIEVEASGLRIAFSELRKVFAASPALRTRVLQFTQLQGSLLSHSAACNRLHPVESRLAKWLLMVQDRLGTSSFTLIVEFMAEMIGADIQAATRAAAHLEKEEAIVYTQETVRIVDRKWLEGMACACNPLMKTLTLNLYALDNEYH